MDRSTQKPELSGIVELSQYTFAIFNVNVIRLSIDFSDHATVGSAHGRGAHWAVQNVLFAKVGGASGVGVVSNPKIIKGKTYKNRPSEIYLKSLFV